MARPNESAVQRIQVGVLGLLAVLLFVYIANLIVDRVTPTQAPAAPTAAQTAEQSAEPKDEPLAELGVTPAVEEPKADAPQQEARPTR